MNMAVARANIGEAIVSSVRIASEYAVTSNVTYRSVGGQALKLDVYQPAEKDKDKGPLPTLMFLHAGGWGESGTKESWALWFLPFLHLGWVVVNVDYRPSGVSLAPAAVQDCLYALRWIGRHANEYRMDVTQLVIAGVSAGGHLALTTGMIPASMSEMGQFSADNQASIFTSELMYEATELVKPAAIVSWCGITDVADVIEGPNAKDYAIRWIGDRPNRQALASAVSPLSYVRPGIPPIVTVHGDKDLSIPYSQAVRLHQALEQAGVPNKLITARGVGHALGSETLLTTYPQILQFLASAGVTVQAAW